MIKIHLNPTAAEQQLRAAEAALAGLRGIAVLKEMKAVFFAPGLGEGSLGSTASAGSRTFSAMHETISMGGKRISLISVSPAAQI